MIKQIKLKTLNLGKIFDNPVLYKQIRQLTIDCYSGMNQELDYLEVEHTYRKINARAIISYVNDKPVGWALLTKEDGSHTYYDTYDGNYASYKARRGYLFEVYVDREYRGKGLGTKLLQRAKRLTPNNKLVVVPWDKVSQTFYDKLKTRKICFL